jgi:hypothetical protein
LGCDDAFAYGHTGDFIVAAVADGAGSVSGTSAWGSYTACQAVLDRVMKQPFISSFATASAADAEAILSWVFAGARDAVVDAADAMGAPVGLLATTLTVVIARRGLLVMGQIGDGIIASESDSGIATHLIEEKDEYANATWFIHSDEAFEKSFRTAAHEGATAFALSTDGMSYKITDIVSGEPFEPFFKGAWQRVRSGAGASDFAALLRGIEDDQTGDDKTMVLAAMQWVEDNYYPSARPVFRNEVSSPPPPPAVLVAKEKATPATETVVPPPDAPSGGDVSDVVAETEASPLQTVRPDELRHSPDRRKHRWRRRESEAAASRRDP